MSTKRERSESDQELVHSFITDGVLLENGLAPNGQDSAMYRHQGVFQESLEQGIELTPQATDGKIKVL